ERRIRRPCSARGDRGAAGLAGELDLHHLELLVAAGHHAVHLEGHGVLAGIALDLAHHDGLLGDRTVVLELPLAGLAVGGEFDRTDHHAGAVVVVPRALELLGDVVEAGDAEAVVGAHAGHLAREFALDETAVHHRADGVGAGARHRLGTRVHPHGALAVPDADAFGEVLVHLTRDAGLDAG